MYNNFSKLGMCPQILLESSAFRDIFKSKALIISTECVFGTSFYTQVEIRYIKYDRTKYSNNADFDTLNQYFSTF